MKTFWDAVFATGILLLVILGFCILYRSESKSLHDNVKWGQIYKKVDHEIDWGQLKEVKVFSINNKIISQIITTQGSFIIDSAVNAKFGSNVKYKILEDGRVVASLGDNNDYWMRK